MLEWVKRVAEWREKGRLWMGAQYQALDLCIDPTCTVRTLNNENVDVNCVGNVTVSTELFNRSFASCKTSK